MADANKTKLIEWLNFVVVAAGVVIALGALYYTKVQADAATGKLTDEANHRFEKDEKEINESKQRLVKLEALTKSASAVAAVQAKVSELQTKAGTPMQAKSLAGFSGLLGSQQHQWSSILADHPLDSPQVQSLPKPAVTLPPDLSWLPKEDKKGLDALLGKADQNWVPPTFTPFSVAKLPAPPPQKSFPENIWQMVKDYPLLAFWLVVVIISALASAGKK